MTATAPTITNPNFSRSSSSLNCNDLAGSGVYDYGFRDYSPQQMRFTTIDPIKDGTNWYSYVSNDPVNKIDLWGLLESDKTMEYAYYDKSDKKFSATSIPINSSGSIDYNNIKTNTWDATNDVRNELNERRDSPNIKTMPLNGEPKEYAFPRDFPNGTHNVYPSRKIPDDHPHKEYLGDVFIPTSASQTIPTYGTDVPKTDKNGEYKSTNSQTDGGYGNHYSPGTTLGCIAFGTQEDANEYAKLSDAALDSSGISILTVGD